MYQLVSVPLYNSLNKNDKKATEKRVYVPRGTPDLAQREPSPPKSWTVTHQQQATQHKQGPDPTTKSGDSFVPIFTQATLLWDSVTSAIPAENQSSISK